MTLDRTTLYLRGVPRQTVRDAKAEAARRGCTLAAYVSEVLARQLQAGQSSEPATDELATDIEWYRAHRQQLVRRYAGRFVAIVAGRVVDHDADFEALAERVFSRIPDRSVFMPLVQVEARITRVRSPRRAR